MAKYSTPKLDALTACDGYVFDVESVLALLMGLDDSRKARSKVYALAMILLLMLLAKLSGADSQRAMAQWLDKRKGELATMLKLSKVRMPCRTTWRRIVTWVVSVEQLEALFSQFLQQWVNAESNVILNLDGKTLRGSIDPTRPKGVHLLAAYLPAQGVVLLQMEVGGKENEIPVAKRLLKHLALRGKIVTGDALLPQRKLCLQIVEAGGEYVFKVKDNQPQLHDDIRRWFTDVPPKPDFEKVETVEGTHGRIDQHVLTVSSMLQTYSDWPHFASLSRGAPRDPSALR